ncbi:MAG: hypothetical protein ABFC57_16945, partial [Veillonellales bacterium]
FDEGGLATPIRCGYLGTVRRKGRKQISQPKEVIASSLLYPDFQCPVRFSECWRDRQRALKQKSSLTDVRHQIALYLMRMLI